MLDQYIKMFDLTWVEPWLLEAMLTIAGALILVFVATKAIDFLNGINNDTP